jgi:hypothetical protein
MVVHPYLLWVILVLLLLIWNFVTNNFSNFTTLTDLDLTLINQNNLLRDKYVILNLNNNNLDNYAFFGSLSEFIRVSLENIITKWPASLFVNTTTFLLMVILLMVILITIIHMIV